MTLYHADEHLHHTSSVSVSALEAFSLYYSKLCLKPRTCLVIIV